jgi:Fe-S cluster biogenesis protein NfuA
MLIQTYHTPNPNTLKFVPQGSLVSEKKNMAFLDKHGASVSPLAQELFDIEKVSGLFFGHDFITVTKMPDAEWDHIRPVAIAAIANHFTSGKPLYYEVAEKSASADNNGAVDEADSDVVKQIKELLNTRIRPAVAQDGGDIEFFRFDEENGILYVRMQGACAGCPSSTMTLKSGIENMMRHYVPQVQFVEQIFPQELTQS